VSNNSKVSISRTETDWKCQEEWLKSVSKNRVKYPEALKVCQKSIQCPAGKIRAANSSYHFNGTPPK